MQEPYLEFPEKFAQIVSDETFLKQQSYQLDITKDSTKSLVNGLIELSEHLLYKDPVLGNTFRNGIGYGLVACQLERVRHNDLINGQRPLNDKNEAPRFCSIRVPSINGSKVLELDMINAQILKHAQPRRFKDEGCLSFPTNYVTTTRYRYVRVGFIDAHTYLPREIELHGLEAIIIQHELDHQNGVLMFQHERKPVLVEEKVSPNAKCPCGSGKKYKRCCQ